MHFLNWIKQSWVFDLTSKSVLPWSRHHGLAAPEPFISSFSLPSSIIEAWQLKAINPCSLLQQWQAHRNSSINVMNRWMNRLICAKDAWYFCGLTCSGHLKMCISTWLKACNLVRTHCRTFCGLSSRLSSSAVSVPSQISLPCPFILPPHYLT